MIDAAVQGTIGFLAVGLAVALFRRLSPAIRCWLWRLVLLKFLVAGLFVIRVPLLASPSPAPASVAQAPVFDSISVAHTVGPTRVAQSTGHGQDIPWLAIAYFSGAVVCGGLLLRGSRPRVGGAPLPVEEVGWLASRLGLRRVPRAYESSEAAVPMLVGLWRPRIVVPPNMPEGRRRAALAHEMAHLRRRDPIWALVGAATCVVLWFLPPVWLAARWARAEAETACDALALDVSQLPPPQYAAMLLDYAGPRPPMRLAISGPARELRRRILSMNQPSPRSRASSLVLVPLIIALAPWQAVARQRSAAPSRGGPQLTHTIASLSGRPEVVRELGLTEAQRAKLQKEGDWFEAGLNDLRKKLMEFERRQASLDERSAYDAPARERLFLEYDRRRLAVLTAGQRSRLEQITAWYVSERSLAWPEFAQKAGIGAASRRRIAAIEARRRSELKLLRSQLDPPYDRSRLSPERRKRLEVAEARYPHASGEERQRLLKELGEIRYSSGGVINVVTPAKAQARRDRFRAKALELKRKTDREILEALTPEERAGWQRFRGREFHVNLPEAWL